ncbi:HAMP domain protein, partial [Operophtera brumata]
MSAFRELRDVSKNFEYDLRSASAELFSAKMGHMFEDTIAKKTKDLAFFSAKLKLLTAKSLPSAWKVVEQVTAKSLTQAHAVKALITEPDSSLDPELIQRKQAIIDCLKEFRHAESQLRHLNALLKEKETEHCAVRAVWDRTLSELRDHGARRERSEPDCIGPLY